HLPSRASALRTVGPARSSRTCGVACGFAGYAPVTSNHNNVISSTGGGRGPTSVLLAVLAAAGLLALAPAPVRRYDAPERVGGGRAARARARGRAAARSTRRAGSSPLCPLPPLCPLLPLCPLPFQRLLCRPFRCPRCRFRPCPCPALGGTAAPVSRDVPAVPC